MNYAELQVTTQYSFLRGASAVDELFYAAKELGIPALGIVDRNTLAGMVRALKAAEETGLRLVIGCRLDLRDDLSVLVYPTDRAAYSRLCRLLSIGKGRAGKGKCDLGWGDLVQWGEGLLCILLPDRPDDVLAARLRDLHAAFGDRAYLALTLRRRPGDALRLHRLDAMAHAARVPTVVTNDVLYHVPERRILQDVMTCIRERCTIDASGFRLERHADRYLKPPAEMARLFARYPDAVERTQEIVARCKFDLLEIKYQYPDEDLLPGLTPQQALEKLTWEGVAQRYPAGAPARVSDQVGKELALIAELAYAPYFLTVYNIVRFARSQKILCQGRGSAANSAVCYVLGITAIDPAESRLLFSRFLSRARDEPPDIDVDFEHERREEVIQWIYAHYQRDKAALCATVIRYRARGAIRDVGRVFGLPEDVLGALTGLIWGWSEDGIDGKALREANLDSRDRRLGLVLKIARQLVGFPRHLSQHPGGFVLSREPLHNLVPIEPAAMADRQVIEWDKDDIGILKMMKVDILGLGMLSCMRRAFDLMAAHKGAALTLATVPQEDAGTYAMIQKADTVGVFQLESRAQMSMLPRLRPKTLYDLVIQVAIVRPGPIQGGMVHPYLKRREGIEQPSYPKPEMKDVLGKTLGVPLFQEQAMEVAIVGAGFTPDEADALRRSMATFKMTGGVSKFKAKMIDGMLANGYERDFAERTFKQIEGFGSYGFPESHAASFAQLAYSSSWLKCHHPDVFCCAILNAQPMGFYAPAQLVRDARNHGVEVRPVDVNASAWDCTLESTDGAFLAVRLGLCMARGLAQKHAEAVVMARVAGAFTSVEDMWRRTGLPVAMLHRLAEADAFRPSLGLARREALWAIKALRDNPLPLFDHAATAMVVEPTVALLPMTAGREVVEDYRAVTLSLRAHPVSFLRGELDRRNIRPTAALLDARDGDSITIAGIVLVRQMPGSANGILFVTLEDETGHANLVVWNDHFERQKPLILSARMLACRGKVQKVREVIHVLASELFDLSPLLAGVGERETPFPLAAGRGDEARTGSRPDPRTHSEIRVSARNFR